MRRQEDEDRYLQRPVGQLEVDVTHFKGNGMACACGPGGHHPAAKQERANQRDRARQRSLGGPRCVYCGRIAETVDHVIPKSRGGTGEENKVRACVRCNGMKSDMTPYEWVQAMKEVIAYIEAHHTVKENGHIVLDSKS